MLYTMLSGRIPFQSYQLTKHNGKDANYILDRIVAGKEFSLSSSAWLSLDISPECAQIIRGLLNVNAKMRMSVGELMNHPWIKHGPQRIKSNSNTTTGLASNLSPMVANGCKMQLRSGALMHDMTCTENINNQLLLGTATEGLAKMVVDSKDSRGESMTSLSKESVQMLDKNFPSSSAVSTSLSNASSSSNGMLAMIRLNGATSTENVDTHATEKMMVMDNNISAIESTVLPTQSLNPNKPKSRWTNKAARESRKRKQQQFEMRQESNDEEISNKAEVYLDDDNTIRPKRIKLMSTIVADDVTTSGNNVIYHQLKNSEQKLVMDINAEVPAMAAAATTSEPRLTTNSSLGGYDSGIQSLTSHYTASIGGEDRSTGSFASTGTVNYSYIIQYRGRNHSDMTAQKVGNTSTGSYSSSSSSYFSSSLPSIFATGGNTSTGSKSLVHSTPSLLNQSAFLFSELVANAGCNSSTSSNDALSPTTQMPFWASASGGSTSSMMVQMVSDANNNKSMTVPSAIATNAATIPHAQFLGQHVTTGSSDAHLNNSDPMLPIISNMVKNNDNIGGRKRYKQRF